MGGSINERSHVLTTSADLGIRGAAFVGDLRELDLDDETLSAPQQALNTAAN
jgi:hypothetical protein